jgi:secreted trypsin-like serine protease
LTAAHCLDGGSPASSYTFNLTGSGGSIHTGAEIFIHPGWTGALGAGTDIALLRLATFESTVVAATLNTRTDEVGNIGTHVGFGRTGTGLTGDTLASGTKRAGNNLVDVTGAAVGWSSSILMADFDNPLDAGDNFFGSAVPLDLEYQIAPGDSGGALFIDYTDDVFGPFLAGVHSFLAWTDSSGNADYGDLSGSTRVSSFVPWILSTMGSREVPEPATFVVWSSLLGGLGLMRVRRQET